MTSEPRMYINEETGLEVTRYEDGSITLDRPAFTNCSDSLAFGLTEDEAAWLYVVFAGAVAM